MVVSSLSLTNVRSFKNAEIQLSPSLNILIGHNNSGKSTVIKALMKLQNLNYLGVEDVRKTCETGRIYIDLNEVSRAEGESFKVRSTNTLFEFPNTDKVKVIFGLYNNNQEEKQKQDTYFFNLSHKYDLTKDGRFTFSDSLGNEKDILIEFKGLPEYETQKNFIYPFLAKRKADTYTTSLGENGAYLVTDDLRYITSKVQKLSNPSHPKYKQFTQHTKNILGFDIGVIPSKNTQSSTGIFVEDDIVIPIENMGEGIVNILGLIVTLLTGDGKLYLIEELENDIHPKALKKLLELILEKSHNNQFVISTHSNIVLKYLGVGFTKIFHTHWKPFESEPEDKLPTSTITELICNPPEKLKLLEELGYDVFDFDLYKSYLIFEESSAESLVKEFLIPVFTPGLVDKVKTLAASGAGDLRARFSDFLRLFVFIHQSPIYNAKAWVFADGDQAGMANIKKLQESFTTWLPEHFIAFSKNSIEEYYPNEFKEEFKKIQTLTDKTQKLAAKAQLTKTVMQWVKKNPGEAKEQFAESAIEIINLLKSIETKIQ